MSETLDIVALITLGGMVLAMLWGALEVILEDPLPVLLYFVYLAIYSVTMSSMPEIFSFIKEAI